MLGVPHTEVDLILVNNESVGFDYGLKDGDRVAVYPVFESFDITQVQRLRPKPLRNTAFIVDVNLGKLARRLRMLGFDAAYSNSLGDREIVDIATREKRIVLTRDRRLLFRKASHSSMLMPRAKKAGSKDGLLVRARIAPVFTSIVVMASV